MFFCPCFQPFKKFMVGKISDVHSVEPCELVSVKRHKVRFMNPLKREILDKLLKRIKFFFPTWVPAKKHEKVKKCFWQKTFYKERGHINGSASLGQFFCLPYFLQIRKVPVNRHLPPKSIVQKHMLGG